MTYKFSNNVSTLLYEEIGPNASEMKVRKLPEGIHWPIIDITEKEVAPCTVIDPKTRAWEIMYIKEIIEGPTYDTLKITRGEEETGPNFFSKNSRVEIRVTAAVLNDYYSMQVATPTRKGVVQVGSRLNVTSDGILSVPLATDEVAGAVKVGNNLIVEDDGTLAVPNASAAEAGVVKLSDNFIVDDNGNLALPIATTTEAGIVKIGDRLLVDTDGTLSAPLASDTVEGMVKIGESLTVADDGTVDIDISSIIDDTQVSNDSSWSSNKIQEEVDKVAGVTWNKRIDEIPEDTSSITDDMPLGGLIITSEDDYNSSIHQVVMQDSQKVLVEVPVGNKEAWGKYIEGTVPEDPSSIIVDMPVGSYVTDDKPMAPIAVPAPYNKEVWITESGEWEVPCTGFFELLIINGGSGAYMRSDRGVGSGGDSGNYKTMLVWLEKGDVVPVTIGAGGVGQTASYGVSVNTSGGITYFGVYTPNFTTKFKGDVKYDLSKKESRGSGGGFGGGNGSDSMFYGAGGGYYSYLTENLILENGKQGVIRLRYYDPNKEEDI